MNNNMSSQELKQKILSEAGPLVDQYIRAALGTGVIESTNQSAREEVWDVLKQLMLESSSKIDIDVKTAKDVRAAVTSGKCTFEEGKQLMELYKAAKVVEQNSVIGSEGASGFTINILNAAELPAPQKVIENDE